MKKLLPLLLTVLVMFISIEDTNVFAEEPTYLDGAQLVNGRTMLPLRSIFENLGATVEWDPNNNTVKASKENILIIL